MPISAILLSILGLGPFIGCGLAALGHNPVVATRMLAALMVWAAVVLSFIGGLHWGLVLREPETPASPARVRHARIGLAVLPLIVGWVAVALPLVAPDWLGLLVLIAGYIALVVVERRFRAQLVLPSYYLLARLGFTVVAVAMLVTVLTLRLLGQTIVL